MSAQFGPVEFNDQHTAATISIDKKIYSKSAVLRACYWFGKDLYFHLERDGRVTRSDSRAACIFPNA